MKRQISADKETTIRSPAPPRAQDRELSAMVEHMVRVMSERYRNQALKALHAGTENKFADAQVGNYATVFLKLARRTTKKLARQFDDKRIEAAVKRTLGIVDKRNRAQLYERIERAIGLSTKELSATEGLSANLNALTLETAQWVKKLRDETLEMYTANSLRAMTLGQSLEEVLQQFDGLVEKRKNHAKFTARNQITNFNSVATKLRSQNLGIAEARWVTSKDERVRPCHVARDGRKFRLDEGLYSSCDGLSLLPGVDYQCRCDYELIIPGTEEA
jgi:SPP1 gp7 family putative phage head morphogenesis protein